MTDNNNRYQQVDKKEFLRRAEGKDQLNKKNRLLWGLIFLTVIGVILFFYYEYSISSKNFSTAVSEIIGRRFGAKSVSLANLKWSGNRATARMLHAYPREGGYFQSLEAENVNFYINKYRMLFRKWDLNEIRALSMKVKFSDSSETISPLPKNEDATTSAGGFIGISIPVYGIKFNKASVINFDADWGGDENSAGWLKGSRLSITKNNDKFDVVLNGGRLKQNWLGPFQLFNAKLEISHNSIEIKDSSLFLGEDSKITKEPNAKITGKIILVDGKWKYDLNVDLKEVNTRKIFPQSDEATIYRKYDLNKHFPGDIYAQIQIQGDDTKAGGEGLSISGKIIPGRDFRIKNFDLLDTLNYIYPRGGLDRLATEDSMIIFQSDKDNFNLTKININVPETIKIQGAINYNKRSKIYKGELDLKLPKKILDETDKKFSENFFTTTPDGRYYFYKLSVNDEGQRLTMSDDEKIGIAWREHNKIQKTKK